MKLTLIYFRFDAERTRLIEPTLLGHWAVGAVVMRPDRVVVEEFAGMVDPAGLKVNKFVEEQVVPYVHLPEYVSREDMLNAFWDFWMDHGGNRAIAVADFGAPVEARFLRQPRRSIWIEGNMPAHTPCTSLVPGFWMRA